jgi:hypothetical protein
VLAAAIAGVVVATSGGGNHTADPHETVTVGAAANARPIPPGFVGLSVDYTSLQGFTGTDPKTVNPVFAQLLRNLAPGANPVIRIGGDAADGIWWPVPGMPKPAGIRFALTPNWLATTGALARDTGAKLILDINFEADSRRLARAEATALIAGVGADHVAALELGNEPELYPAFTWYKTADGVKHFGRPKSYKWAEFIADFGQIGGALPDKPLAGPATGVLTFIKNFEAFLAANPRLGLVTLHRYPLQRCYTTPKDQQFPSIAHLLAQSSSRGLADSIVAYVQEARSRNLDARIDEFNDVSCSGAVHVSGTFASALWVLDALFEMARAGVSGVNIHSFPGALYGLFDFSHQNGQWSATVKPEYYGALLFARAASPGSRLLQTTAPTGLKTWATRARDGTVRVVLINVDPKNARAVNVRAPANSSTATIERLRGPSLTGANHITIGGRTFGASTTTGRLPQSVGIEVPPSNGGYPVTVPPASAVMLTLAG